MYDLHDIYDLDRDLPYVWTISYLAGAGLRHAATDPRALSTQDQGALWVLLCGSCRRLLMYPVSFWRSQVQERRSEWDWVRVGSGCKPGAGVHYPSIEARLPTQLNTSYEILYTS